MHTNVGVDYMSKKITIITGKHGCEKETSVDSRNRRSKLKTQINTNVNTSPRTRKGKICKKCNIFDIREYTTHVYVFYVIRVFTGFCLSHFVLQC